MPAETRPSEPRRRARAAARLVAVAVAAGLLLSAFDVSAARLGGGRASGLYRPHPTRNAPVGPAAAGAQRQAGPQAAPQAGPQAQSAGSPRAPGATAATPQAGRWLAPLAGLAAGLGLGALLSHLGLAPAWGSWLMVLLLALGGYALLRTLVPGNRARGTSVLGPRWPSAGAARPHAAPATAGGGFDDQAFVASARELFLRLQQAHDSGDLATLRDSTTPDLFEQFHRDLIRLGDDEQSTEVMSLHAHMLEHVEHPLGELASVRFSGLLREGPRAGAPESFDEVWHFTRPRDRGTAWLLAGIQPAS